MKAGLEGAKAYGVPTDYALHDLQGKISRTLANGMSAKDLAAEISTGGDARRISSFYNSDTEAMLTRKNFGLTRTLINRPPTQPEEDDKTKFAKAMAKLTNSGRAGPSSRGDEHRDGSQRPLRDAS